MEYYLYHATGLGDHIICNGMVRFLCEKYQKLSLFCLEHNYVSVKFMFRDLHNLKIINLQSDYDIIKYLKNINNKQIIKQNDPTRNYYASDLENIGYDHNFYNKLNIDFNLKWKLFNFKRNIFFEIKLYKEYNPNNEDYIFIHDDKSRNYTIKEQFFNSNYKIIQPERSKTNNIFDYVGLLEKAKEIHCIDSSFLNLCELIKTDGNLYYHQYARKYSGKIKTHSPTLRKKWIYIDKKSKSFSKI